MDETKKKAKRFWRFIFVLIVGMGVGYFVWLRNPIQTEDTVVYIALTRAHTGKDEADGIDTLRGVQLYLEEINYQVNGIRIELLDNFDDQSETAIAVEKANEIAASPQKPIIVIGHAQSGSSIEAGKIYAANGIPAISGSAIADELTINNEWYFRTIPNSRTQSIYIANYMRNLLAFDSVIVIYDEDEFGRSLAEPFLTEFETLGGTVACVHSFSTDGDLPAKLDTIVDEIICDDITEPIDAIYFATHPPEGVELIVKLKRAGIEAALVGASPFANINFINGFQQFNEEQLIPGYFSDGIIAISPVIFDVAGVVGQDFRNHFVEKYNSAPGSKAATNYDAVKVAVQAIAAAGISGDPANIAADRQRVRDYLAGLNRAAKAIDGVTGQIFFDRYGNVVKPLTVGFYEKQQLISAMVQLQPIKDVHRIADYDKAIAQGRIFTIDDQPVYKTDVAYTGIDFIEISNLSEKDSTYSVDFYLWFRSRQDVDAENIEFINVVGDIHLGAPIAEYYEDGIYYRAYRVKSDFVGDFQFQAYPFDSQELPLKFRHANRTREKLIYVVDFLGMELPADKNPLDKITVDVPPGMKILNLGSWIPTNLTFSQNITLNHSTLGNPKFFGAQSNVEYSRFNANLSIKRDVFSFGIKNLLPLFAVMILAYISVLLPPDQFATKNAIDRGALLTVAFFHIKLSNDLPGIGYNVALDYVFYVMYALIVFNLVMSSIIRTQNAKENHVVAQKFSLVNKFVYPLALLVGAVIFLYQYQIIDFPFRL